MKQLSKSLNELGLEANLLLRDENFKNVDVLNLLIINGVSKQSLGNQNLISEVFKGQNNYKTYFKWLQGKINAKYFADDGKMDYSLCSPLTQPCFVVPNEMTVLKFYEAIRNSIAHKNIVHYGDKYLFFMAYPYDNNGKGKIMSIKTAFKNRTQIIIVTKKLDDIAEYGKALFEYMGQKSK